MVCLRLFLQGLGLQGEDVGQADSPTRRCRDRFPESDTFDGRIPKALQSLLSLSVKSNPKLIYITPNPEPESQNAPEPHLGRRRLAGSAWVPDHMQHVGLPEFSGPKNLPHTLLLLLLLLLYFYRTTTVQYYYYYYYYPTHRLT